MDLNIAKNEFLTYTEAYDLTNFQIKRKVSHSLRVMQLCTQIAESLEFSQEEADLATLIGLLHDIARFEQYTKFQTFNDSISFDHGQMGVKILEQDNFIRRFVVNSKFDHIIFSAIYNHNKFKIEANLLPQELTYAKIIRDADKLDIMYQGVNVSWKNSPNHVEDIENAKFEEKYLLPFIEKRPVNRATDLGDINHEIKHLITMLGFVFDMNFKMSFEILKKNNYINDMLDRFDFKNAQTKQGIETIRKIVNDYIEDCIL